MKLAIMQPYFCPYIGYFQLVESVDKFVIYDNIEFSKKGWFIKNQFLMNGAAKLFSIPIKKGSDYLHVNQRELADNANKDCQKVLSQIENSYRKAPFFKEVFPLIKLMFLNEKKNLFEFIYFSFLEWCKALDIKTEIIISSEINIDHNLKGSQKVIALCKSLQAETYINAQGGRALYEKADFEKDNIDLKFIEPHIQEYQQNVPKFIPYLSIIDVAMFNGLNGTKQLIKSYQLN